MRVPSGSLAGLTNSVAPNLRAHSSLLGLVSTAMTRDALTSEEVAMTPRPMAPQPKTATVEPAVRMVSVWDCGSSEEYTHGCRAV